MLEEELRRLEWIKYYVKDPHAKEFVRSDPAVAAGWNLGGF